MPQHCLNIEQLHLADINNIFSKANYYATGHSDNILNGEFVVNLFFESSTRTINSFYIAATKLGAKIINVPIDNLAINKGESITNTILTLNAMGCKYFVIRTSQEDLPQQLADTIGNKAHIINAGSGLHAHPSQALIDLFTIIQFKKLNLDKLKIAIVGDLKHSRVANSQLCLFNKFNIPEIRLIAPAELMPEVINYNNVYKFNNLEEGLLNVDVVIALRIQQERHINKNLINIQNYQQLYCINNDNLRFAKPDAILMHPGPVNINIDIAAESTSINQNVVLQQVTNGIAIRQAIFHNIST